ncbi:MAG: recombinase family protein [Oscillospiraceae bacterium]|nr:recombinase family protein [Oscillospiraceae bacterium]
MARKSRKTTVAEPAVIKPVDKVYRAGLYARISVETERKREADTIGNQLQLLKDYVSEHSDLTVFDIYSDDDISGTDFIRPEFSRMMNDLRDGKIDCIIVKDLSRLGRNYLESGEYIEMVFPFFRCRFISVTDRFDTKYQQADISVQLKNMANEMYAKDISRKICSTMRTIQDQGKFAGSRAPYGYRLDPADKHHLIIDEETAPIVKQLFELLAEGNTVHFVATTMNANGIPSPGRLLYERGIASTDHFKNSKWYMQTVRRILQDEIYLGWMVSGKFRSTYHSTGKKGSQPVPREEWIVTKGTHEPIVTEELFNKVQEYFVRMKEEHGQTAVYNSKSKKASIFKGHLRCGECGQAMFLRNKHSHGKVTAWYYCALHENYNSSYCVKKAVKKQDVEDIALKLIRTQIKLFTDAREMIIALNKKESSKTKHRIYSDQIRNVKKQIEKYMSLKASLYEDFANGVLSQSDYISMGQEYAQKADELRIFLAELEKEAQKYSQTYAMNGSWAQIIEQYQNAETLTEEMIDAFMDEMILYNNGHVEVKFRFKDELDEVIHLAAIRQREVERYAM